MRTLRNGLDRSVQALLALIDECTGEILEVDVARPWTAAPRELCDDVLRRVLDTSAAVSPEAARGADRWVAACREFWMDTRTAASGRRTERHRSREPHRRHLASLQQRVAQARDEVEAILSG